MKAVLVAVPMVTAGGMIVGAAVGITRGARAGGAVVGTGANVNPIRLKGVKVMSPASGVAISELSGRDKVTGTVGIRVDTPTPTVVTRGTAGRIGAGKRDEVFEAKGTCAKRPYPVFELMYDGRGGRKGLEK